MNKAKAWGIFRHIFQLLMSANQRSRFRLRFSKSQTRTKLDKSVSRSAARIQMTRHQMSQTLSCRSDFHDTLHAPLVFTTMALHIFFDKK